MKRSFLLMLLPWMMALFAQGGDKTLSQNDLDSWSITQLEEHLAEIDSQLGNLASFSLRGGIGAIGYRSYWDSPTQWIEIELDRVYPIDEIVLVPCLWRHPSIGFQADAFPRSLRVSAGTESRITGSVIAEYSQSDLFPKGIEPLALTIPATMASWIRIEATELSERNFDGHKVLQLAEVLVFSGSKNVALQRPIECSSNDLRGPSGAWNQRYLVDGFMPYLMDSASGSRSNAFIANFGAQSSITLDLGSTKVISRIHMHTVEQSDTVPQAYSGDLGIPNHMRIEGSNFPDFSTAVGLIDYRKGSIHETGPIIIVQFPETPCRYVRFIPLQPTESSEQPNSSNRIGFAEIEIFADDQNVALGRPATSIDLNYGYGQRALAALTDGNNLYGKIIPMRDWMNELAARGALERERPIVLAELNLRYSRQKTLLARMVQLVLLLVVVIGFIILIDRHIRLRKVNQVRERIAADLHDELGANIYTIGLISDMARNAIDSRDELIELLDEIHVFTVKSGEAARYCTNILEARGICEDLVQEMKRFSDRALADLKHETAIEGEDYLQKLDPHKRIDLLLFYKECITNILRHSEATKVQTSLSANLKTVQMTVTDNGKGLRLQNNGKIPPSLNRRAKLLSGKITTEKPATGGTQITLKLKIRKFGFLL